MIPFLKKRIILREHFRRARESGYAIGQFNFSTLEQLQAIVLAADNFNVPVICGTSKGEADFFGAKEAPFIIRNMREKHTENLFLNFDHGKTFQEVKDAIDAGYDMVHFDGSCLPFEENIKMTKKVVAYAKKRGVVVEGEVSKITGKSSSFAGKIEETTLTSLDKIVKFITQTKVDCIALDVGNVHGIYSETPRLHLERIDELLKRTSCFVVLHGGSGIEDKKIRDAIERGVVKVNINTELRVCWKESLKKVLIEQTDEVVPYKIMPTVREAVQEKVEEKIKIFSNV